MDDFIFGSMDTDALRLKHHKELHAGIAHFSMRNPRDPRPGQPVTLSINVGQLYEAVDAWVYYSTDGIDPEGDHGKAIHGCVARLQWVGAEWDDLTWGYVHHFECILPGQPDQTVVRYRICILTADGQQVYADHGTYYAYAVDQYQEPGWVKAAVIYHIMLDRFAIQPGKTWNKVNDIDEIYGGDLKGLQASWTICVN